MRHIRTITRQPATASIPLDQISLVQAIVWLFEGIGGLIAAITAAVNGLNSKAAN